MTTAQPVEDPAAPVVARIWHTPAQAAERAQIGVESVRRACRSGALVATQRVARGTWRIHAAAIDEWVRGGCQTDHLPPRVRRLHAS